MTANRPWTKEPWEVDPSITMPLAVITVKEGLGIAILEPSTLPPSASTEAKANAHLIAQAPTMYEALEAIIVTAEIAINVTPTGPLREKMTQKVINARATLAAANPPKVTVRPRWDPDANPDREVEDE